jgi:hypothetical protein
MSAPITATSTINPLLMFSNISIFALWAASSYILIPYPIHLLLLVTFILYSASHFSLFLRQEQALSRGEKDPTKNHQAMKMMTMNLLLLYPKH